MLMTKGVAEAQAVAEWRGEIFFEALKKVLPESEITVGMIETLVASGVHVNQLEELLEKGCDPETAIRIVV